ncbi:MULTISPECIES: winged helix-turn-helix domain-containing protein [unclassified Streptomyces]|uniref:winged helix-turn-helix domain-containing protein n=1 Tax=unclassified Streptomyces TaxID=2593676 RepID=UPI00336AC887
MLDTAPVAAGWSDQCWTLARTTEVVGRRFGVEYTLAGWTDLAGDITRIGYPQS